MRTETIELFQYDELSDKAKARARDWYREATASDPLEDEFIFDDFIKIAGFCGWTVGTRSVNYYTYPKHERKTRQEPAINWSGFSCQGDGAQFEGSWAAGDVEPAKLKEHAPVDAVLHKIVDKFEAIAKANPDAEGSVKSSRGGYCHKYATEFDAECFPGEAGAGHARDWIDATRDLMQWLYDSLEKEYEYQTSDEAVSETIKANEYEFTADGNRYQY